MDFSERKIHGTRPDAARLTKIRAAHDMAAEGKSTRAIAVTLQVSRDSIQTYLRLPRPTDEDLAAAATLVVRKTHPGVRPCIRIKTDPETLAAFEQEALRQGCSISMLGDLAVQLYLDAAKRLRGETDEPIPLRGYVRLPNQITRARFNRNSAP
jgi:hypothetical protein